MAGNYATLMMMEATDGECVLLKQAEHHVTIMHVAEDSGVDKKSLNTQAFFLIYNLESQKIIK
ncbi:hypothetical protein BFF93_17690 [Elizabethkingia meningoseptica]|nr:hypothetical protein BES09_17710 [Elizabethkingia meningoseptica]OHT26166.1 hypothetical protein BFF93_17690 [Elizabethkingia meningoseptica]OPB93610.1 hypothetical protein BAS10_13250 [Elizabethkingia meningoseptica]OPC06669.1 hypothetical protein BAX93_17805 [Elizabethkingia meningoseptica]